MSKIISPKLDFCAKELFRNETVRNHFLSDVLDIPLESIQKSTLGNTFLWKRHKKDKQGVLDVRIELNDDTKINIEIQINLYDNWDKRSFFYIAKMFVEDLFVGEDYRKLKKCVGIYLLDFTYIEGDAYHTVYKLRDREGKDFTDIIEIHVIELKKAIRNKGKVEEWIQFFNIQDEEDLNMITTKNQGIKEAIAVLREISLGRRMRILFEARQKRIRDERAIKSQWQKEARAAGMAEGRAAGMAEGRAAGMTEGRATGMTEGRAL